MYRLLYAQCIVDFHQSFRADICCHVDGLSIFHIVVFMRKGIISLISKEGGEKRIRLPYVL